MSVIVTGMDKPNDCYECPFVTHRSLFQTKVHGGQFICSRQNQVIGEATYAKCPIKPLDEKGAEYEQP